jgi:hypothetical protein
MIATTLVTLALLFALPQSSDSADSARNMQQRAHEQQERHRRAALRINDLAAQIQNQANASALVVEIVTLFSNELPPVWLASGIDHRIADAEYQSARDPAKRIPEQRIVDVWNQYLREIGAPDEAFVTVAEIHNMRDADRTVAQHLWARGYQTIWIIPNIYAVGTDGRIAEGCRAIEAIRVIYDLYRFPQNLRSARERVKRGVLASEQVQNRITDSAQQQKGRILLAANAEENLVQSAERRYLQEHGSLAYDQLLKQLFDELFPAE